MSETKTEYSDKEGLRKSLEDLFVLVPPTELRKSITMLYFEYLSNLKLETAIPPDFNTTAENIHSMIVFLQQAEEILSKAKK